MQMPPNRFKAALAGSSTQYGLWAGFATGYAAEIAASTGYDWLLIDGEHAPNTVPSILAQLQAVAPYASAPVVRAVNGDSSLIKQLLDIGVQSLMVPMVETAEQARQLVRAMRYPPHGIRGVGGGLARATRWDGVPDYLATAHEELCLIVQVESKLGWKTSPISPPSKACTRCLSARRTCLQAWAFPATPGTPRCRRRSAPPSMPPWPPARSPGSSRPLKRTPAAIANGVASSLPWASISACSARPR